MYMLRRRIKGGLLLLCARERILVAHLVEAWSVAEASYSQAIEVPEKHAAIDRLKGGEACEMNSGLVLGRGLV